MAVVWTIGHSTRTAEEFIGLLRTHRIVQLIDVRRYPSSKRFPQFNRPTLDAALTSAGVPYYWLEALGGYREQCATSAASVLRNAAFRGYAEHMLTEPFRVAVQRLLEWAASASTAVMCAEASPRDCHRSLLSDYLASLGVDVRHILDSTLPAPHTLTVGARIVEGRLSYNAPPPAPTLFG